MILNYEENKPETIWQELIRINPSAEWDKCKTYAKSIVDSFNSSRKPGETKRILVKILKNPKPNVKSY